MNTKQTIKAIQYLILIAPRAVRRQWRRMRLASTGLRLTSSVIIEQDPGCMIIAGAGSAVGAGTILIAKSRGSAKNHIVMGEGVAINEYNNLRAAGGDIHIGNHCQIAQFCTLVASNHTVDTEQYMIDAPWETTKMSIRIEEDVWIGASCIILPGVTIGRGAVIGAGSVVTKDVPRYSVYAGNPARLLRVRHIHA